MTADMSPTDAILDVVNHPDGINMLTNYADDSLAKGIDGAHTALAEGTEHEALVNLTLYLLKSSHQSNAVLAAAALIELVKQETPR